REVNANIAMKPTASVTMRPVPIFIVQCLYTTEVMMRNLNRKPVRQIQTHDYTAKPLPFRMPLSGISNRTIENHHDKLYTGYVKKMNEIQSRLEEVGREIAGGKAPGGNTTYSELRGLKDGETYAVNGVYLHEWYFEGLGGDGKPDKAEELVNEIEQ